MASRISEDKINEVRAATDIVEIVSAYLTLKKSGKNYFGLCPFHAEKTPSFSVNPQLQIFRCWGCNAGGNVFTFLMKMDGLSFPAAVRRLAERAGITLPEERVDEAQSKEKEALYYANRLAAEFYYRNLMHTDRGRESQRYFEHRGLDLKSLGKFGLGYAPDAWDGLISHAASQSLAVEVLHKAGLVIPRRGKEGYYDRFRNRIMFPIFDVLDRVVGFGGRRITEDATPKYLNSPETTIYKKSRILYGLSQAKEAIRQQDKAILVEGYTDLLSLFQRDIKNVVATSGTALTEEHAKLLRRYTARAILLYDADSAGASAAVRGADILLENGLEVRVSRLPKGEDPDTYVRSFGADQLTDLIKRSETLVNFKITSLRNAGFFKTAEKKARAVRSVLESIAKIPDEIKRNLVAQEAADALEIDQRLLLVELEKMRSRPAAYRFDVDKSKKQADAVPLEKPTKAAIAERVLLGYMLSSEKARNFVFEHLEQKDFQNEDFREIVGRMSESLRGGEKFDATRLQSFYTNPKVAEIIAAALSEQEKREDNTQREARVQEVKDSIVILLKRPFERQAAVLRVEIKEVQSNKKEVTSLMKEYQRIQKKLVALNSYWITKEPSEG